MSGYSYLYIIAALCRFISATRSCFSSASSMPPVPPSNLLSILFKVPIIKAFSFLIFSLNFDYQFFDFFPCSSSTFASSSSFLSLFLMILIINWIVPISFPCLFNVEVSIIFKKCSIKYGDHHRKRTWLCSC